MDLGKLQERFFNHISNKWIMNDHNLKEISCVYAILAFDFMKYKKNYIAYIGSTTKLFSRYKSHKIPSKVQKDGYSNLLFYIPMKKGFYDYEIKLIKKLQPKFNRQHK